MPFGTTPATKQQRGSASNEFPNFMTKKRKKHPAIYADAKDMGFAHVQHEQGWPTIGQYLRNLLPTTPEPPPAPKGTLDKYLASLGAPAWERKMWKEIWRNNTSNEAAASHHCPKLFLGEYVMTKSIGYWLPFQISAELETELTRVSPKDMMQTGIALQRFGGNDLRYPPNLVVHRIGDYELSQLSPNHLLRLGAALVMVAIDNLDSQNL
jgi:hypothetical protein